MYSVLYAKSFRIVACCYDFFCGCSERFAALNKQRMSLLVCLLYVSTWFLAMIQPGASRLFGVLAAAEICIVFVQFLALVFVGALFGLHALQDLLKKVLV